MSATAEIATIPSSPASLLQTAVENGASVDQLSKLMDLQERWDRESARKEFYAARAKFQSICPKIDRNKEVSFNNTTYKYATLDHIVELIKTPLEACGLTFRWEIADKEGGVISVSCILSHVSGHSESNAMPALADDSGSKNKIQQRGSTVTYLQRYTLVGVLGIASADEDDDGKSSGEGDAQILINHLAAVREHFDSIYAIKTAIATGQLEEAIEAFGEISKEDKNTLWMAPTKGGVFTTAERKTMQSDEWVAARNNYYGKPEDK